jgi:hypothetical protein
MRREESPDRAPFDPWARTFRLGGILSYALIEDLGDERRHAIVREVINSAQDMILDDLLRMSAEDEPTGLREFLRSEIRWVVERNDFLECYDLRAEVNLPALVMSGSNEL